MTDARRGQVRPAAGYRRDRVTWAAFAVLLAFGVLNAGLGPALPYLRRAEHISYLAGVLHQVGFALGGGLAGVLAARARRMPPRALAIRGGLIAAALAWLAVGYGDRLAVTVAAAFAVSLLATTALIRVWALLADEHGARRAVAMSEGEVAVSLGGVISPLLVSLSAATALGWRGSFVFAGALVSIAVAATFPVRLPDSVLVRSTAAAPVESDYREGRRRRSVQPTLLIIFAIVGLEFSLTFWLASYLGDDVGQSRQTAAAMVSVMYLANLIGRVLASRLARQVSAERLLAAALALTLLGLPLLLVARGAPLAGVGLSIIGIGIGGTFPLTSALHIAGSPRDAEGALGQVLATAAVGEIVGPVVVAGFAQPFGLRVGLLTLVGLTLLAAAALRWHASGRSPVPPVGLGPTLGPF